MDPQRVGLMDPQRGGLVDPQRDGLMDPPERWTRGPPERWTHGPLSHHTGDQNSCTVHSRCLKQILQSTQRSSSRHTWSSPWRRVVRTQFSARWSHSSRRPGASSMVSPLNLVLCPLSPPVSAGQTHDQRLNRVYNATTHETFNTKDTCNVTQQNTRQNQRCCCCYGDARVV